MQLHKKIILLTPADTKNSMNKKCCLKFAEKHRLRWSDSFYLRRLLIWLEKNKFSFVLSWGHLNSWRQYNRFHIISKDEFLFEIFFLNRHTFNASFGFPGLMKCDPCKNKKNGIQLAIIGRVCFSRHNICVRYIEWEMYFYCQRREHSFLLRTQTPWPQTPFGVLRKFIIFMNGRIHGTTKIN